MPQKHCQGDQTVLIPRVRKVALFCAGALAAQIPKHIHTLPQSCHQAHDEVVIVIVIAGIVIVIVVIDVIVVIVFVVISLYVAENHHGMRSPIYGNKSTERRGG